MPCDLHATAGAAGQTTNEEEQERRGGLSLGWAMCKLGVAAAKTRFHCRAHYCQLKTCQQFATTINRATNVKAADARTWSSSTL